MSKIADYLTPEQAAEQLLATARELNTDEIASVRNLAFVPNPHELYFLASRAALPLEDISAFAVDMDGTSTTTEPLALHALEYMVRRVTGRTAKSQWKGLDKRKDVPFVVGSSNFRHTEFLLKRYANAVSRDAFRDSFFEALLWTLANMDDHQRREDVRLNALNCGLAPLLEDPAFREVTDKATVDDANCPRLFAKFVEKYGDLFHPRHFTAEVSAAMDIYYHRYHSILKQIEEGKSDELAREFLGNAGVRLVAPMAGYGIFLCLVKGWLTDEAVELAAVLRAAHADNGAVNEADKDVFLKLIRHFNRCPAKISLVTASIAYEAHAVMEEVMHVVREEVAGWPVSDTLKDTLRDHLAGGLSVFDGFVTASDSSEARLKPHRDLYSVALHQMSIPRDSYAQCVAIEDTEPGIIPARAAGFGTAVALPNRDTTGQNYEKASVIVRGGLPELILDKHLLLDLRVV